MNRSYDLHAWKLFLRVAETGNLSVVAAELGMELSTLSRAISTLEKSIGHNLFEPNSRPKRLTRIGAIATEKLRETIAMHEEFLNDLHEDSMGLNGLINLSVSMGYSVVELPHHLSRFNALYPEVVFQIQTGLTVDDVRKKRCDLAGQTGIFSAEGLITLFRAFNYYLPLASPAYIAEHGMPLEPKDLKSHTVFFYNGPTRSQTRSLRNGNRIEPVQGAVETFFSGSLSILQATLEGHGVATDLPINQCHEAVLSGQLVPILPGWYRDPMPLTTVINPSSWRLKRVRLFAQWLNEEAGKHIRDLTEQVRQLYRTKYQLELPIPGSTPSINVDANDI